MEDNNKVTRKVDGGGNQHNHSKSVNVLPDNAPLNTSNKNAEGAMLEDLEERKSVASSNSVITQTEIKQSQ